MFAQPMNPSSGYYGKIPATGDFIKYNLTRAFVEPWDDWLQASISYMRKEMGNEWLDAYLTSPIYRFVLTPGICGENGWQGVIMPSVDRVGRYFPMTICAPLDPAKNPFQHILHENDWFSRAESLILSVLEDGGSADTLNQSLQTLDTLNVSSNSAIDSLRGLGNKLGDSLAIRESLPEGDNDVQSIYSNLLNSVLLETGFAYSLWRTAGSEKLAPSLLLAQGLPPTKTVGALLDGNWSSWGWMDNLPSLSVISPLGDGEGDPWDS
jgi:type VI secretion system protein ImpM